MFRIKELRLEKGLSMRQTSIELGMPYTTYISYEKEDREPNSETLIMLADYFNCSIDYLIGRSNDRFGDFFQDDNMTIGQRIRNAREMRNISQVELANRISVSKQTLYKYENDIITNIPSDKIEAIATAVDVTPAYLMGWENNETSNVNLYSIPNIEPLPKMKKVPLLGTIACGEPILAEENIEDYINMPENTKGTFALRCKGDSMINARIFDGDFVFVREQPDIENGEIAAVLIDNEATLKRVYKYENRIELRAENPTYKPLNYEGEQLNDIKILGKAVGFFSRVI